MKRHLQSARRISSLAFPVFMALLLVFFTIDISADSTATTTTLASSNNASVYGETVTLTATITPDAAVGTVTFKDGSTTLGSSAVEAGTATYSTDELAVGSHTLKAYFVSGDSTYADSTSGSITQTVSKADTTITLISSEPDSDYKASVTFTATVSAGGASTGTPAGTVTFKNGTSTLGTDTLSSGEATYTTSSLAVGTHSITAVYAGNSSFSTSTSTAVTQTVIQGLMVVTIADRPAFTGMDYSQTLHAIGGDGNYTWSKTGTLPTGITLGSSGVLSGSPSKAGVYTFTATVTDGNAKTASGPLTITVREPGYLYNWGENSYGQLGTDSTSSYSVPIATTELDDDDIIAAATGGSHSLAVNEDGETYAWGYNDNGQLGINSTTTYKEPEQVDDLEDAIAVAAGFKHSLALDVDGNVWAWGDNAYGQLGIGSTTDKKKPYQISDLADEDVVAIAAGYNHSIALKSDGTVWTWGYNNKGQLGVGSTTTKEEPVQVLGGEQDGEYLENIVAIAAGNYFNLALDNEGNVWAWGDNSAGQLGNGTKTTSKVPVLVDDIEDISGIACGYQHALAVDDQGDVYAWGDNGYGQLGNGSDDDETSPIQVDDVDEINLVAAGNYHSMALDEDGDLYVWGYNNKGQLGLGSTTNYDTPEKLDSVDNSGLFIAASNSVSLLISSDEIEADVLTITTSSLDDGTQGESYSDTLSASGGSGDYKWTKSSGTIPSGLSLNSSTGKLSGTPSVSGDYTFTIKVVDNDDSALSDSQSFTITIEENDEYEAPFIETTDLEDGKVNQSYSQTLTADGGSGVYSWYKYSGNLPPGLSLNSGSGKISGTPSTEGDYNFVIKVVDDESDLSDTSSFVITIDEDDTTTIVTVAGLTASNEIEVNASGYTQSDSILTTTDDKLNLEISSGTILLDSDSKPLTSIGASVQSNVSGVPVSKKLISCYNLTPENARFNPAIELTFLYEKAQLPSGVDEKNLYIALYDGAQWTRLASSVDVGSGTVTANIDHFSIYGLFGDTSITTTTPVNSSASPTGSTHPPTSTTSTTASNTDEQGHFNWWLVIGITAGVLVILIVILVVTQRKKSLH